MSNWQEEVEPLTLKGGIKMPYTWSVGETGSRFLTALRDRQAISANRCSCCDTVYVPPRKNCARCFKDIEPDNWLELSGQGTIESHTRVNFASPVHPVEPPFVLAIIKLEGADVGFTHIIKKDLDKLKNGAAVKPVFSKDPSGTILDIDSFELAEGK